jgi:hypothetical protein
MSWKKHGGLSSLEQQNNLTVHSITTDFITIRNAFLSVFTIKGDLTVLGEGFFEKSITIKENLNVKTLDVSQNATIEGKLFMNGGGTFLYGSGTNFGINTETPQATLDISSSNPLVFSAKTSNPDARSVIAKNSRNYGLVVSVKDASSTEIQFYNGTDMDISSDYPDAKILFDNSDNLLLIDSTGDTKITSNLIIADNRNVGNARTSYNETLLVYDNIGSVAPFFPDAYIQDCSAGNAVTLVSIDESSKTFMNIATPNKLGLQIGGGSYPNDTTRSMGIIDVFNPTIDPTATPAIMIISGNTPTKYNATTGFNTFAPKYNNYAVDINGPVHINNGELKIATRPTANINIIRSIGGSAIAVGGKEDSTTISYFIYTTEDGKVWEKKHRLLSPDNINVSDLQYKLLTRYGTASATSIYGEDGKYAFYTNNGTNWNKLFTEAVIASLYLKSSNFLYVASTIPTTIRYGSLIYDNTDNRWTWISYNIENIDFAVTCGDGSGNTLAYAGENDLRTYDTSGNGFIPLYQTVRTGANYKSIRFYDENYGIAVGTNTISHTKDRGQTWTHVTPTGSFNDVFIYDALHAVTVGDGGVFYTTLDGADSWSLVNNDTVNASGIGNTLINTGVNLTSVWMPDLSTFIISTFESVGGNKFFYLNMPNIFNNKGNTLLDISGCIRMTGDLHIDGSGSIVSHNEIFYLLDEDVITLNIGSAATTVNIGSSTAAMNIGGLSYQNQTGMIDISNNIRLPNLYTTGNTDICGNVFIYQNVDISNNLTVHSSGIMTIANTEVSSGTSSGALRVSGGVGIQKNIIIDQTAYIKGNTTTDGILSVQNTNGLTFGIDPSGTNYLPYIAGGAFQTIGSGAMRGELYVDGISRIGNDMYVYGNLYVKNTLTTGGQNNVANVPDPWQGNSLNDATNVSPCLYAKGGLRVDLNTILNGNININGITISTTTDTGALQVIGGVGVGGNINVGGAHSVFLNTASSNGTTTGALQVMGGIGIGGNINVGGTQSIFLQTTVSTSATTGALQVRGGVGISGNLFVGSATTTSTILGNTNFGQNGDGKTTIVKNTLQADGPINLNGTLQINGPITVTNGTIATIPKIASLEIMNTTAATSISSGALQVLGGVGIAGKLHVGDGMAIRMGATTITIDVSGISSSNGTAGFINTTEATAATGSGALYVVGGIRTMKNIYVGDGTATMTSAILNTTPSTDATTGAFVVSGGMGIGGNMNIGSTGTVKIINPTASGGTMSGAMQIVGGVGIGGNMNIGGSVRIMNADTSTSTTEGALQIVGGMGVGGNVNIGPIASSSTMGIVKINNPTVSGSTASGALQVVGGVGIGQNINVGGIARLMNETNSMTTTDGALQVVGGVGIGGNMNIGPLTSSSTSGIVKINNPTASGSISSGALQVVGGVGIGGNVNIGGTMRSLTVVSSFASFSTGQFIIANAETISMNSSGNISITAIQPITMTGEYIHMISNVTSNSTTSGALQVVGGVGIGGNMNIGPTTSSSTAGIVKINNPTASGSTASGALQVVGGVGIGGATYIGGMVNINSGTSSTTTTTGSLVVSGGVGISGAANIGGMLNINSGTSSTTTTTGSLVVSGGVGISGAANIGTDTTTSNIMGNLNIGNPTTNVGTTTINNQLNINPLFFANIPKIEVNNQAIISSTTNSSSTDNGALRVVGGVGIGGAVNIGRGLTATAVSENNALITATGSNTMIGGGSGNNTIERTSTGGNIIKTATGTNTIQNASTSQYGNYMLSTGSGGGNYIEANNGGNNRLVALGGGVNSMANTNTGSDANLLSCSGTGGGNTLRTTTGPNSIQSTTGQNILTTGNTTATANLIDATATGGGNRIRVTTGTNTLTATTGNNVMLVSSTATSNNGGNLLEVAGGDGGNVIKAIGTGSAAGGYNSIVGRNNYYDATVKHFIRIGNSPGTEKIAVDSYTTQITNTDVIFTMGDRFTVNCFNNRSYSTSSQTCYVNSELKLEMYNTDTYIKNNNIYLNGTVTGNGRINAVSFNATSDRRIKQNVSDLSSALPTLRELSPKSFQYIDASKNMHDATYGFIAQDIKQVIPNAVSIGTGWLPNIYEFAQLSGTTITLINKTTVELKPRTKIRLLDASNSEVIATIVDIIDTKTFTVESAPEQNTIFVYGTFADDFHYINPDTIWTVGLKAMKELDTQLQDARTTIQSLVQRITELEMKLSSKPI